MAVSDSPRKNHEELFPGHVCTLAITDPELIEIFDNFAFDEVLRHSRLDIRTRLMVQLAALIACGALSEYRVMLGAALTVGVTRVEAKEIAYQAVPHAGMGKVFDFIHATNDVLTERGIQLPLERQATPTPATRAEKGRAVQERIVGADRVEHMYASAADGELHFQRFLPANCFGDHYCAAQPSARSDERSGQRLPGVRLRAADRGTEAEGRRLDPAPDHSLTWDNAC